MPAPHHSVFTGQMPFLPPNQQCQSTEGKSTEGKVQKYESTKSIKIHFHVNNITDNNNNNDRLTAFDPGQPG